MQISPHIFHRHPGDAAIRLRLAKADHDGQAKTDEKDTTDFTDYTVTISRRMAAGLLYQAL